MAIGLVLVPVNYLWIIHMEVLRYSFPTYIVPFYNAVFSLFILITLNMASRKFLRKTFLSQGELLTIYVMLSACSALASINMMQILISVTGHAFWFATPENEWKELIWEYLPKWLTISDKKVLTQYYNGESTLFQIEHLKGWLLPIASWLVFTCILIFVMLCINVLLKKQWTETERLTYPIARLPIEMTKEASFFKNKLMWIGFAVAGGLNLLSGLHFLYPAIPGLNMKMHHIGYLFSSKPWNAVGGVSISFYPFAIGLGFLMPLSLSSSCWVFYILYKVELVVSSVMGLNRPAPYPNQQTFGAYIGICLFALWAGRKHFKEVFSTAFARQERKSLDEGNVSYKTAILGMILGTIFLIMFAVRAGMTLWVAVAFFVLYFVLAISVTRMRAELGFPVHDMHNMAPDHQLITVIGSRRLGYSNLTVFSLFRWFNRTYASHPMPHQLEGFQMTEKAGVTGKKIFFAIMLATAFGVLAFFFLLLQTYYTRGADSGRTGYWTLGFGIETFNRLQWRMSYPTQADHISTMFMGVGLTFSMILMVMRTRFFWWTLHPLGYAVANSWGMAHIWFPLLISSTAKWTILKYGGIKTYQRAVMIFLGLILGEFVVGSLWNIIGILLNIPTYQFWI